MLTDGVKPALVVEMIDKRTSNMTRPKRKGWADINPPVSRVRSTMYVLFDDRPSVHKNSISAWDGSLSGTAMGVATTKNALRLSHVQRIHSRTALKKKYYYVHSIQLF